MPATHFERMIQLADEIFATKNDPDQLDVNQDVLQHLQRIHASTVSEYNDGNGPAAWVLVIPTTRDLMKRFLEHQISEKELFILTPLDTSYEALYLCSAMVLAEYRRKGIAKQLALEAIEDIRKNHPLTTLFVWSFTGEGDLAAEAIAHAALLPLCKRLSSI